MIMLSPIFILGIASILLLLLLFLGKYETKKCAIFTLISLSIALVVAIFIGYKILTNSQPISDINSENRQMAMPSVSEKLVQNDLTKREGKQSELTDKSSEVTLDESSENSDNRLTVNTEKQANSESPKTIEDIINQTINSSTDTELTTTHPQIENEESNMSWHARYVTALFACDGYGLLYTTLILMIAIVVACFAYQWFKDDKANHGLFYIILLFTTFGGVILVYASHLISLFLGIELLSIPFVGLIGYQYTQKHSLEAAIKYMVLSAVASAILLMGIAFYYAATGELTFSGLSYQLSTVTYVSALLLMGVCLMLVGIGFKLSLVPFQLWLPDVYQGAPTAVSLLFSTVGKVAIFCAIARLFLLAPIVNNETIRTILIIMSFCSILWGSFFALMQSNIKRLLAYSSISHFGYLITALIAVQYQVLALETIGVFLIGYILANICLLGGISLESHSTEQQDHERDIDLSGLFWRRPILALSMGIGLLSLAGVPLTVGFFGRFLLLLLSVTAELWWLIAAIILGTTLGLYFYSRLIIILFMRPVNRFRRDRKKEDNRIENQNTLAKYREELATGIVKINFHQITVSELLIMLSAFLILLFGIYPKWLFDLVSMAQYLTS